MSQITCTKWHNTNKMAEFKNDINKVFGNISDWFRINVLSLNLEKTCLHFLTKTAIKLPLTYALRTDY